MKELLETFLAWFVALTMSGTFGFVLAFGGGLLGALLLVGLVWLPSRGRTRPAGGIAWALGTVSFLGIFLLGLLVDLLLGGELEIRTIGRLPVLAKLVPLAHVPRVALPLYQALFLLVDLLIVWGVWRIVCAADHRGAFAGHPSIGLTGRLDPWRIDPSFRRWFRFVAWGWSLVVVIAFVGIVRKSFPLSPASWVAGEIFALGALATLYARGKAPVEAEAEEPEEDTEQAPAVPSPLDKLERLLDEAGYEIREPRRELDPQRGVEGRVPFTSPLLQEFSPLLFGGPPWQHQEAGVARLAGMLAEMHDTPQREAALLLQGAYGSGRSTLLFALALTVALEVNRNVLFIEPDRTRAAGRFKRFDTVVRRSSLRWSLPRSLDSALEEAGAGKGVDLFAEGRMPLLRLTTPRELEHDLSEATRGDPQQTARLRRAFHEALSLVVVDDVDGYAPEALAELGLLLHRLRLRVRQEQARQMSLVVALSARAGFGVDAVRILTGMERIEMLPCTAAPQCKRRIRFLFPTRPDPHPLSRLPFHEAGIRTYATWDLDAPAPFSFPERHPPVGTLFESPPSLQPPPPVSEGSAAGACDPLRAEVTFLTGGFPLFDVVEGESRHFGSVSGKKMHGVFHLVSPDPLSEALLDIDIPRVARTFRPFPFDEARVTKHLRRCEPAAASTLREIFGEARVAAFLERFPAAKVREFWDLREDRLVRDTWIDPTLLPPERGGEGEPWTRGLEGVIAHPPEGIAPLLVPGRIVGKGREAFLLEEAGRLTPHPTPTFTRPIRSVSLHDAEVLWRKTLTLRLEEEEVTLTAAEVVGEIEEQIFGMRRHSADGVRLGEERFESPIPFRRRGHALQLEMPVKGVRSATAFSLALSLLSPLSEDLLDAAFIPGGVLLFGRVSLDLLAPWRSTEALRELVALSRWLTERAVRALDDFAKDLPHSPDEARDRSQE